MKKRITILTICLLLAFLLAFPKEALAAAREGLGLWLDTLLPTLLPFLILTGILLRTDGITRIVQPIAPFFKVLTGLSGERLCSWPALRLSHGCKAHRRPVSRRENQPPGIGIPADLLQQSKSCLSCYICGPDLSGGKSSGGISGRNSVSFRYDLHVLFPLLRLSKKKHACFGRPGIYRKQGSRTGRHPRFRDHEQF